MGLFAGLSNKARASTRAIATTVAPKDKLHGLMGLFYCVDIESFIVI